MSELEIPESWATAKLVDVCERAEQRSPKEDFTYIDIDAVDNKTNAVTNPKQLVYKDAPSRAKKVVRYGDVLFSTVRPYLKNIAIVPELMNPIASTGFCVLRPNRTMVSEYLFNYVRSDNFLKIIEPQQKGASYPAVSDAIVLGSPIPLPPLGEQKRIVAKIESCFSKIDAIEESVDTAETLLKKYRESLLAKAFRGELVPQDPKDEPASKLLERIRAERGDSADGKKRKKEELPPIDLDEVPFEIPKSWEWVRISEVGFVQLGRQRAPKNHSGKHMRKYLRVANVFENRIDVSDVLEMNFDPSEQERYRLKHGDILLNEGQSRELVGRPAMYRDELPEAYFQNTLVRFQANDVLDRDYALCLFLFYFHTGRFTKIAKAGTNMAHLGAERFAALPFPLPPISEQKRIVSKLFALFSKADQFSTKLAILRHSVDKSRSSVLTSAFRGALVAQEPSEGTGHELLLSLKKNGNGTQP